MGNAGDRDSEAMVDAGRQLRSHHALEEQVPKAQQKHERDCEGGVQVTRPIPADVTCWSGYRKKRG